MNKIITLSITSICLLTDSYGLYAASFTSDVGSRQDVNNQSGMNPQNSSNDRNSQGNRFQNQRSGYWTQNDVNVTRQSEVKTSDSTVKQNILTSLKNDSSLSDDAKNITVDVSLGIVTLNGTVKSEAERSRLEVLARSSNGVKNVINKIDVNQ